MAQYQVRDPQGQMHVIAGPEGASPDEVMQQAQSLVPPTQTQTPQTQTQPPEEPKQSILGAIGQGIQDRFPVASAAYKALPDAPWTTVQKGLKTLGGNAAEGLGEAGYPKTGAVVGTGIAMIPDLLSAYSALPGGVRAGISGTAEQMFKPLANEAGAAFPEAGGGAAKAGGEAASGAIQPMHPVTPGETNIFQRLGSKGVNSQAGITGETVQAMTRAGQNPGEVGAAVGQRLANEGALGQSPTDTYRNVQNLHDQWGQKVKDALSEIKTAAGGAPNGADPLQVNALDAMKPLTDKYTAMANSPFSGSRRLARPWNEAYNYLAQQAERNGGTLTIDHINETLGQVGDMLGKFEKGTESYKNVAKLYGTLANTRDQMVHAVAQAAGNPQLATNLLKANSGYSFYSRIKPDVSWAAANESVGGPEMSVMGNVMNEARPFLARGAVKVGSNLPAASQATSGVRLFAKGRFLPPGQEGQ